MPGLWRPKLRRLSAAVITLGIAITGLACSAQETEDQLYYAEISTEDVSISVMFDTPELWQKKDIIDAWIQTASNAIRNYYSHFPVNNLNIALITEPGNDVVRGWVLGGSDPVINIHIGDKVTPDSLSKDWILAHEMAHLAFADVDQRWIEEGLATYVESIARASAGQLSSRYVWKEFMKRMPLGQPKPGDRGLDRTPTWGRTYWGGAMFALVADVSIRKQSQQRYGLQDALRGIIKANYTMKQKAAIEQVLQAGDKAVGLTVLSDLYHRHKHSSAPFPLQELWHDLGLALDGDTLTLRSNAPNAALRQSILPDDK